MIIIDSTFQFDFSGLYLFGAHSADLLEDVIRKRVPRHAGWKDVKRMAVRDPRDNPLHNVNARKQPDVQERRATVEDTLKLKERPSASAPDVGEGRDPVAADSVEDQVPDCFCNRVEPFRRENFARRLDNFARSVDVRFDQLDRFESLSKRDVGIDDEVGLIVEFAAGNLSGRRDIGRIGDDRHCKGRGPGH